MNKSRNPPKKTSNVGRRATSRKADAKGREKTLRQRKVSAAAVSKWQSVPAPLQQCVMSILEDSKSRFVGSENETVDTTLDRITLSVQRTLRKIKVPQEKWTDMKLLKAAHGNLLAEKARLEELEAMLKACLDKETRQLEKLEAEADKLKGVTTDVEDEQLHPVLQRLQDPV